MLETVAIVLNERESNKRKVAEALEAELKLVDITSSRFDITSAIEEIIVKAKPRILVVDYLLGDYSTGLDILAKLAKLPSEDQPKTIFLTDEPSVSVAVEAMKLGAVNYVEFNNPKALPTVIDTIRTELNTPGASTQPTPVTRVLPFKELVAHADSTRTLLEALERIAKLSPPAVVLSGPPGSGKQTLSRALSHSMNLPFLKEVDLRIDDSPLALLTRQTAPCKTSLRLGHNLALLIRNAQEDSGEVLDYLSTHYADFFAAKTSRSSLLIVNTTDDDLGASWARLTQAEHLRLLPLGEERKQDIPALIQFFSNELARSSGERVKAPGADFITWASSQSWPHNLTELRAVLENALLAAKQSGRELIECAEEMKACWEEAQTEDLRGDLINPITAARTLETAEGNFRIAAARLGCSPCALRSILNSAENVKVENANGSI